MPRKQVQDVGVQPFIQSNWGGGINTAVPADRIADTQAVDILNFEFDQESNLVSRSGVEKFLGLFPAQTFATRITSLHYYENDVGNVHILFTSANKLYRANNIGTSFSDITGALTFPTDTIWQWKNLSMQLPTPALDIIFGLGQLLHWDT